MAGLMSINGFPDKPPLKVAVPIADMNAGMFALYGILSAYINRLKTGEGQYLETSLMEGAMAYTVWESSIYWATGEIPMPNASAHRLAAPYDVLRTSDGYLNVGAATQNTWELLCRTLGREELIEDERFIDNALQTRAKTQK